VNLTDVPADANALSSARNYLKGGQGNDVQRVVQPKSTKARTGHWQSDARLLPRGDRREMRSGGADRRSHEADGGHCSVDDSSGGVPKSNQPVFPPSFPVPLDWEIPPQSLPPMSGR